MKQITFYLDFVSPYAWLAFQRLPQVLQGLSYCVDYRPVLLAGLLKAHGQLGPAEIAPKRAWTYRHVLWTARELDVEIQMPASHPFNPLPLLRLALACAPQQQPGLVSRAVCETVFRHVWQGGGEAADPQRTEALAQRLQPRHDPAAPEVKAQLQANGAQALAQSVFGVPAMCVQDRLFWGLDALPMLRACLQGDAWFDGPQWHAVDALPIGVRRRD